MATGPFFGFHKSIKPKDMQLAHQYLDEVIEEEGPFDGVMAFSVGGSLVASYLLQHVIDHPHEPRPFRFAIFFSPPMCFSPSVSFLAEACTGLAKEATEQGITGTQQFDIMDRIQNYIMPKEVYLAVSRAMKTGINHGYEGIFANTDDAGPESYPRPFHPAVLEPACRIDIPVAVIYGSKDPWREQSELLVSLCNKDLVQPSMHSGGHDLPRTEDGLKEAVRVARAVIQESRTRL